jgi:glycine cleavage system aminomethyltransferase T
MSGACKVQATPCEATGVADLSRKRERWRISGDDRVGFLQGQCANDVQKLALGQSCYAAFSPRLGKPLALGYVRREFAMAGVKLKVNHHTAEVLRVCGE